MDRAMSPSQVWVMRAATRTLAMGVVRPATVTFRLAPAGLLSGIGTGPVALKFTAAGSGVPDGMVKVTVNGPWAVVMFSVKLMVVPGTKAELVWNRKGVVLAPVAAGAMFG